MEWKDIFDTYRIQPNYIEQVSEKVYKLNTNSQNYCLKFTSLTEDQIGYWNAVYRYITERQVYGFVPVILTKDNHPLYLMDSHVMVMSPWVDNFRHDRPADEWINFFHGLGKLHGSTLDHTPVSYTENQISEIQQFFRNDKTRKKEELLQYIRYFESKRYMSPFELQACMHYRDLEWMMEVTEKWQSVYLELLKEKQSRKAVLCHGNLAPSHYTLLQDNIYFFNWEYARIDSPSSDLVVYLNNLFTYHDCDMNKVSDGLSIYFQYVRFQDDDICELMFDLFNLESYFSLLNEHVSNSSKEEIRQSIQLEKRYRQLVFANQLEQTLYAKLQMNQQEY
ncbi:phosphotransferase [Gracilibacillus oryzae]|uniref:Phosphotransferase n=1 Tax=Gracilibacillus oryzae TaxID=1672701 RepID=A0A7C8KY24_9BACI|nr:phosphotransferase [Gracilibacillus oryzae]KAB8134719.1 phosphotransferase [Gracilibacillus oryzae]